MFAEKLVRLCTIAQNAKLDAIALIPGANLYYLTGVNFHLTERPFIVIVPVQGDPVIIVPTLEMDQLKNLGFPGQYFDWRDADGYEHSFKKAANALNLAGKKIGVEGMKMRVREGQMIQQVAEGAKVIDADEALEELRIIKTAEEVENHRKANQISEQALSQLLEKIELGMTERQIATLLSQLQKEYGGSTDAFGPTVLIGSRSAFPHGVTGDAVLKRGDTLLIDYGTIYNGYMSDITRTFFVGEPDEKTKELYAAVLAANTAGRETAKPGVTCEEVDRTTAQVLRDSGFNEYVKHRTGHGLGIDIHEHPNITIGNRRRLEPGMVFTIEPGLYVEGKVGIRIEDNVVVTENGLESLTTFPRELTVLDL